jgi:hypothetical protein
LSSASVDANNQAYGIAHEILLDQIERGSEWTFARFRGTNIREKDSWIVKPHSSRVLVCSRLSGQANKAPS